MENTVDQLIQQVQLLTVKVTEQGIALNTASTTRFQLSASQVIKNFNDIKAFSGEDNYKLKSFFKSVENVEDLCGNQNQELRSYGLRMIINSKIIGKARNTILEIPEHQRNWVTVQRILTLRFKPKYTVHQLLFEAKGMKVFNLKDLFNKLNTVKSDASEICDFDNSTEFTYESIDKELVLTLKSKVIPILQIQIDEDESLFDLDNHFCKSEIYLSSDVIKFEYKLKFEDYKKNQNFPKSSKFEGNKNQVKSNEQNKGKSFDNRKPWQDSKPNYNQNKSDNFVSGQYKQNFNKSNNSGQYQKRFYNSENKIETMEIDNLVEVENEEIETEKSIIEEVNFQ